MDRYVVVPLVSLLSFFLIAVPVAEAQTAGTLTGRVTDAETGRPLPGVNLVVGAAGDDSPRGTSTGPEGRFTLDSLAPGTYTVQARFVGYAPQSREVRVPAGSTVRVRLALSPRTVGLETVEVTARRQAREAAEKIQKADIQEANPRDAGELMRKIPGTSAVRRGPVGLDPVVRGLRETQVGVYVDGMRTFPAGPARMDSPLSHTGPSTMQSVEVAKGPYALTWGGGQLSAIRVETNSLFRVPRGEALSGRVQTGYDSNFDAYDVTGTASGRRGDVGYRVDGAYRQGNVYQSGDGTTVPADFLNRELRAKVGYKLGANQRLTVGGGYQRQDDVSYPGRLLNAEFFESGRGRLGYEYTAGQGLVRSVEATAYGYQTLHTMDNKGKVTYASEDFPGPPLRVSVRSDITTVGGRAATELVPSPDWRLTLGADGYRAYRDAERPFRVVMNGEPVVPPFYESDQIWPGVSIADVGAFAQGTRLFGAVEATGTVRADLVWAGAEEAQVTDVYLDIAEPGDGALPPDVLDQREVNVSGALMLSAPLSEAWSLSVGGGTAVRTASALERFADRFPANKSQTARRNAGSVSPTISRVTPPARLSQRRRRISVSSTWSSSRPRSTAPSRRAAPRRTSSPPTRRSRPSTTTRSSTISTRRQRASWPSNGPHFPTRFRYRQERESGFSVPPVTGQGGTGRKRRSVRSRPRRGSTTSVGTASATRRVSTRSSTTPSTRCGWFQRWR